MSKMLSIRRLLVSGVAQGVGYRYAALVVAERLGVCGWVRNLSDGRVEAAVWGDVEAVARFIAWSRSGPAAGRVSEVLVEEGTPHWPQQAADGFVQRPAASVPETLLS